MKVYDAMADENIINPTAEKTPNQQTSNTANKSDAIDADTPKDELLNADAPQPEHANKTNIQDAPMPKADSSLGNNANIEGSEGDSNLSSMQTNNVLNNLNNNVNLDTILPNMMNNAPAGFNNVLNAQNTIGQIIQSVGSQGFSDVRNQISGVTSSVSNTALGDNVEGSSTTETASYPRFPDFSEENGGISAIERLIIQESVLNFMNDFIAPSSEDVGSNDNINNIILPSDNEIMSKTNNISFIEIQNVEDILDKTLDKFIDNDHKDDTISVDDAQKILGNNIVSMSNIIG